MPPLSITGPNVWTAATADGDATWRFPLSSNQREAVLHAAARCQKSAHSPRAISANEIELSSVRGLLRELYSQVETGRGFALIDNVPLESLDYEQQVALMLAISNEVGQVVVQNFEGDRIVDVRDEGIAYSHQSRGYRGSAPLPFHTDGANLFSLTCLGLASAGGETVLVSASAAYNAIAAHYPQHIETLANGFYHHRRGQHEAHESPLSTARVPVFAFKNGLLHCCYNRNPIEWAQREGIELSAHESDALDALDEVLNRPELQLRLTLVPGQCLVVNNFVTLHSRTAYVDSPTHRRHLLRVWMNDSDSVRGGFSLLDLYVPSALRGG
jgi:alpha-ketoglutarate-dependent taurine dioxygenase